MKKRTTIKDVAALAGVSFATVSRALDDRPEISAETKERVRAACAQLNYVPNAAAKGLAGQSTHTLGLIVTDISNPYFARLATAIEKTAAAHGYRVLLSNSLRDCELEIQAVENFLARRVDGMLISSMSPEAQARDQELLGDLPCVYLGANHGEDCSSVSSDNEAGAYAATRYLLDLGHRDILYLGGRSTSLSRAQRVRGFYRAMREAGLEGRDIALPPEMSSVHQWSAEEARKMLGSPLPDAVFAFSDTVALKLMGAAALLGIHIPGDLSLIGYDDNDFSALPRVHLTTVSQNNYGQGVLATERLLERIGGSAEATADVLSPKLIIRSTCLEKH